MTINKGPIVLYSLGILEAWVMVWETVQVEMWRWAAGRALLRHARLRRPLRCPHNSTGINEGKRLD